MPLASCRSVSGWAAQASKGASESLMSCIDMSVAIIGEAIPQHIVRQYSSLVSSRSSRLTLHVSHRWRPCWVNSSRQVGTEWRVSYSV